MMGAMMGWPHRFGIVVLVFAAAACGARTGLNVGGSPDDGGGGVATYSVTATASAGQVTAGGSLATTGSGGSEGPELTCTFAAHRRVIADSEPWHQVYPKLTFSSGDHREVTLAMRWSAIDVDGASPELRYAQLDPWDEWPDELIDGVHLADTQGGASFRPALAADDKFSVLFSRWTEPGLRFSIESPGSNADTGVVVHAGDATPLFAEYGGQGHLVGYRENSQAYFRTIVGGATMGPEFVAGCSATGLLVDGAAVNGAWLIVGSKADPPCPAARPEAATWLEVQRQAFGADSPSSSGTVMFTPGVSRLDVVGMPDVAWVIWQAGGNDAEVLAARLDALGQAVDWPSGGYKTLSSAGMGHLVAARRMGENLMLLTRFAEGTSTPGEELRLTVFDPEAKPLVSLAFAIEGLTLGADVLASPVGDQALLAFAETFNGRWRIATIRIDCTLQG